MTVVFSAIKNNLEILDVNGRVIYEEKGVANKEITLNLENNPSGIYFISVPNQQIHY